MTGSAHRNPVSMNLSRFLEAATHPFTRQALRTFHASLVGFKRIMFRLFFRGSYRPSLFMNYGIDNGIWASYRTPIYTPYIHLIQSLYFHVAP